MLMTKESQETLLQIEGVPVNFNAGITSDNSGDSLTYDWDFNDGTNKQGKEVTHTFENVSSAGL